MLWVPTGMVNSTDAVPSEVDTGCEPMTCLSTENRTVPPSGTGVTDAVISSPDVPGSGTICSAVTVGTRSDSAGNVVVGDGSVVDVVVVVVGAGPVVVVVGAGPVVVVVVVVVGAGMLVAAPWKSAS
jgi:hypothetical protein